MSITGPVGSDLKILSVFDSRSIEEGYDQYQQIINEKCAHTTVSLVYMQNIHTSKNDVLMAYFPTLSSNPSPNAKSMCVCRKFLKVGRSEHISTTPAHLAARPRTSALTSRALVLSSSLLMYTNSSFFGMANKDFALKGENVIDETMQAFFCMVSLIFCPQFRPRVCHNIHEKKIPMNCEPPPFIKVV